MRRAHGICRGPFVIVFYSSPHSGDIFPCGVKLVHLSAIETGGHLTAIEAGHVTAETGRHLTTIKAGGHTAAEIGDLLTVRATEPTAVPAEAGHTTTEITARATTETAAHATHVGEI